MREKKGIAYCRFKMTTRFHRVCHEKELSEKSEPKEPCVIRCVLAVSGGSRSDGIEGLGVRRRGGGGQKVPLQPWQVAGADSCYQQAARSKKQPATAQINTAACFVPYVNSARE